jgi:hypothetical protein
MLPQEFHLRHCDEPEDVTIRILEIHTATASRVVAIGNTPGRGAERDTGAPHAFQNDVELCIADVRRIGTCSK